MGTTLLGGTICRFFDMESVYHTCDPIAVLLLLLLAMVSDSKKAALTILYDKSVIA
jgi:hypothetical protein